MDKTKILIVFSYNASTATIFFDSFDNYLTPVYSVIY